MPRTVRFYYPIPKFPSVSITGPECDLKCNHCKGHYLQHMPNTSKPELLKEFCMKHEATGGVGLLISGGSTIDGRVPLKPFLKTIRWVKDNTDLVLNLHTGMLTREAAEEIASTGVDITSVDIVGSQKTLREVYGLDQDIKDYGDTLIHLRDGGVPFIAPHICVGLHFGEVVGERRALELASEIKPETIVFISLIPTVDTPMAKVTPPKIDDIVQLIAEAKEMNPDSDISLGCMRSRDYKKELEWRAIEAGADRIALASRSTERKALDQGYRIQRLDSCCATPRNLDHRLLRA